MPIRRAVKRPELRVLSAPEKPNVRFAVEPFYVIAPELPPLFKQHWRELGRDKESAPLDPDWDQFLKAQISGNLHILTARDESSGKLVGYVFTAVGSHLHYKSTKHANVDMYWLHPDYRRGWTGIKMLRRHLQEMEKLGVVRSFIGENLTFKNRHQRLTRVLLRRLGYRATDVIYRKVLND